VPRRPLTLAKAVATVAAIVCGTLLAGCGGDDDDTGSSAAAPGGPTPLPGFYLTAASSSDLEKQAYAAGARFAGEQTGGHAILALDFGAARLKSGDYGTALRGGTFFSNDDIGNALEQAAKGYGDHHESGSATIVYANSNAFLGDPGSGYTKFGAKEAAAAGKEQAEAVHGLDMGSNASASVGGDIEPGYDKVAAPSVAVAMVEAAADGAPGTYYDFGTAPCDPEGKCVNGWRIEDICNVAGGSGRSALPEIYFDELIDQPRQWGDVKRDCKIDSFAGVSASPLGRLSPPESYKALRKATKAKIDPVIVVFPG
jgi:hypothetical protein